MMIGRLTGHTGPAESVEIVSSLLERERDREREGEGGIKAKIPLVLK